MASPLLQALPVEQVIEESPDSISQKQQPLRKYYFNVGKLQNDGWVETVSSDIFEQRTLTRLFDCAYQNFFEV